MTVGLMMCITIPAFIAVPVIQAGQLTLLAAAPLVLVCLIGLYGAARFFWSVRQEERARSVQWRQSDPSSNRGSSWTSRRDEGSAKCSLR